ncbi:MAG: hypothetical protein DYG83_08385 [Candidatus Brocadia sp. AMX2]|uniref:Hypothetical cytochrome b membrane protein n=1 Tax=Candidatus Brocadia sinica JPN1 TaxID=1197129 RepID=A0ABQ0K0M2_9BACT|nr:MULTISPECIES: hypothetical protein [Brocadia]KXK25347.1 MAG: putative cytochrome b [Candidatus Brocadia sinica]MBC6932442.1 hypothetical protein [Candidatus Brocadia sp.]MBL1170618.1 hypothetical protein [Candidatus Brocadia sp. AMX1]NOG42103.1 hypothetical protein [Planctomycetota bacterium]KAA0244854.1 MAG: hypothetical protein EDM70_05050 [Candidatus Brocadia sp. AMX2]
MKDYTQGRTPEMLEPFFPNEMFRYIIVSCFLLVVECIAVVFLPLPFSLIEKPDYVPWFGLPFYELHKYLQNDILLIFLMVFCALFLVSWPFLENALRYNPKNKLSLKRIPANE